MPIVVIGTVMEVNVREKVEATTDRPAQDKRCEIDVYVGPKQLETVQAPIEHLMQFKGLVGKHDQEFPCSHKVWHMGGKTGTTWKLITDEK